MRGIACTLEVTRQRWRSHHSLRRSRKPHATHKLHGSMFYRTRVTANWHFTADFRSNFCWRQGLPLHDTLVCGESLNLGLQNLTSKH